MIVSTSVLSHLLLSEEEIVMMEETNLVWMESIWLWLLLICFWAWVSSVRTDCNRVEIRSKDVDGSVDGVERMDGVEMGSDDGRMDDEEVEMDDIDDGIGDLVLESRNREGLGVKTGVWDSESESVAKISKWFVDWCLLLGCLGGAMDLDPSSSDLIDFKSFVAREDDGIVMNIWFYFVVFDMKNWTSIVL